MPGKKESPRSFSGDRRFQYTSQIYFALTQEYGLTPSRSGRSNCYDNTMAESFFAFSKTEYVYRHRPNSVDKANQMVDDAVCFYSSERIQMYMEVAQLTLRHSA